MAFRLDPIVQTGQFVQLPNGLNMHYASRGDQGRPLVVLLHGFPQFWFAWYDFMCRMQTDCFVVAPDLRGYNRTDKPTDVEDYRIDHLVSDITGLVSALGYDKASIVAHDWGGAVAWSVAIRQPAFVRALMILNAPHPIPFARMLAKDTAQQRASRYMNDLRREDSEASLLADNCAALLAKFRARDQPDWVNADLASQYRAAWTVPGAITGMVNYYRASPLYPPQGRDTGAAGLSLNPADFRVDVPTQVVWGMKDSALLPGLLDGLDELIDDYALTRIDDATHWLLHEQPERVGQHVQAFIDRTTTNG